MGKFKAIIISLIFIIGLIPNFQPVILKDSNDVARRIRNLDAEIKVFQDSEGRLTALVIPEGAYKEQGFHVPREIPTEALLQVGVNIRARGDNSFRVTEGAVYEGHVHTPIENPRREMFIIKEGIAKLTFYSKEGIAVKEKILHPGDVAFITQGHSVEFLTDCKVIEIKEGPYPGSPEEDKIWLEAKGKPKLDGLNFTGLATSIRKNGEFMDPVEIFRVAVESDFVGPVQIYLDKKAQRKMDKLKTIAKKNNIPLIVHSFSGMRRSSSQELTLTEEIEATFDLLEYQEIKRVVLHFHPEWQREELIGHIEKFNKFGLIPCIENPIAGYDTYKKYISILKEVSKKDLEFDLVIDIGKLYQKESSLGEDNAKKFLTEMLDIAKAGKKSVILHLIDSTNPEFEPRKYWVPVGGGLIPYKEVVDVLSNYHNIISSTIFEYEDMDNTIKAKQSWLKMVEAEFDKSRVFGPDNTFLGAVLRSPISEFDSTKNIPIKIKQEKGAQVVRWQNNGYEMIYVKSGTITIDLLIDGKIKPIELNQGDVMFLMPEVKLKI